VGDVCAVGGRALRAAHLDYGAVEGAVGEAEEAHLARARRAQQQQAQQAQHTLQQCATHTTAAAGAR
jgi:hypothetical protein